MNNSPTHLGKIVLVTGAASGIGQALAEGLAARGAQVAAVDKNDPSSTVRRIRERGFVADGFVADLTRPGEVSRLADEVHDRLGLVDAIVNNAGTSTVMSVEETDLSAWHSMFAVNLDSQFLVVKAFMADMVDRGWGRIVNVASSSIFTKNSGVTAYMASKAAVLGFTSGLANDLGPHGITVNAVSPGFTRTPLVERSIEAGQLPPHIESIVMSSQAIPRHARPDDLVGLVAFLTGDDSGFVTAKFIAADGGASRF